MELLAQNPATVFVGQQVRWPGTAIHDTLSGVSMDKRVEFPVAENMQLGYCLGLSLMGKLPVCIYPRINFLLEATSQLVQHLDKLSTYSGYSPKVIIRTAVATPEPLDPGPQHLGDYSHALGLMLQDVRVVTLEEPGQVLREYDAATRRDGSTLLVERTALYA